MPNKATKNSHSHDSSYGRYQSVVLELDQMLKQSESNTQKTKQSSKKHMNKHKNLANDSPTGIKEFDELLDGGFPKGAVVLLAGSSGSGKTIFASQWLFEGVKNNENGLYITLTESLFKILENLEKMNYYDRKAIEQERLKIVDMREHYEKKGFGQKEILDFIEEQVKQTNAKRLCIDSITAIAYHLNDKSQIRTFIFELGTVLATLGCTTILTNEVADTGKFSMYDVEEFISDAIVRLDQIKVKDEFQRTMRIVKVRGKEYRAETIPLIISSDGIRIFPKIRTPLKYVSTGEKISTGNLVLDEMLQGGFIQGSTTLAAGSTGTGKTLLCLQFIMDGLKKGEPCLYASFEESKEQLTRNAKSFGWNLEEYETKGLLTLHGVYPSDKLLEEHLKDIKQVVESNCIKRCVIDSLSSISHAFDEEAFYSFAILLNGYLKVYGVTTFFTAATGSLIGSTALAENNLSTLTDNILMLRYVEMQGKLESVINILKMRGSGHCKDLRKYEISNKGIVIGPPLSDYEGIMTGSSKKIRELEEEGGRLKNIIKEKEEIENALRDSEERFRDISYSMADWIWEIDKDGKYTFSSGNVKDILGFAPEELIGKTPFDLMPKDEAKHTGKNFLKIISENEPITDFENWCLTKNGEKICLLTNGVPLFDEGGKFIGYRGVDRDITVRKKMEQDMRIKDNAIMSSINAIAFVNLEGEIIYANPSLLNMWEYDSENRILGKPAVDLWQMKGQYLEIMDVLKNEGGWVGELTAKKSDESLFIVQMSASMVKDEENNPLCMMASFMDVTDRKRMERNLKKFKTITDRADYGSITYDIEGNIFYTNESFARMHGYSMGKIIGKNLSIFYNENQVERIKQLNDQIRQSGSFVAEEIWHKRKDGTVFPVLMTSTLIKDEKKKLSFLAATVVDITDIKNAEKKLLSNANKLRNLNGELNLAKEELSLLNKNLEEKVKERTVEIERLLKQKDEFIGQLGHDLKTPLTPMMTLLPILRRQMKDTKSIEMLDTVIRNVHFMKDLVIETIDLTGINSTNMEFSIEDIDLLSEVNNIIKNNQFLLEDNNFKVDNKVNEKIVIEADKLRFEEIFNNLISNAIKYTPESGSTLTINAKKGKDFVTISMSDTGIGMTEEQLSHIFDEFYKADGSRHDLYSHGLGLSICKNIVEKHGGKIWAESPGEGKGSTFYFTFKRSVEK